MTKSAATNGGAILFELRHRSGMSQTRLSGVSGVSVRTIRGIETGRNRFPHASTLMALAGALDLRAADTERLMGSAQNVRALRSFGEMAQHGATLEAALSEASVRSTYTHRMVSISRHTRVGPNRRVRWVENEVVAEALHDGFDNHLVVESGDQALDTRLLRIEGMEGCRLSGRHDFPELNTVVFELSLGAPPETGDTRVLRYRFGMGDQPPTDPAQARLWDALEDSDGMTHGFSRTLAMHIFRVSFEGCRPTRLWEWRGTKDLHNVGELTLDDWGSVHLFGQNREPGNYGVGWSWD
ncbi:MAG: helix-turn-helix domain-containing protein [Nocardioides sp.]|nr:helix-turn-helix domain-containing protein [Nocardioides sp.]